MQDQVFPSLWLQVSHKTRQTLMEVFGVKRSASAEVSTGANGHTLISDGVTPLDLLSLTKEKMSEYTGLASTLTSYELFTACVDRAEGRVVVQEKPADVQAAAEPAAAEPTPETKPFCEFCDSKGVKHKSNCTRPESK